MCRFYGELKVMRRVCGQPTKADLGRLQGAPKNENEFDCQPEWRFHSVEYHVEIVRGTEKGVVDTIDGQDVRRTCKTPASAVMTSLQNLSRATILIQDLDSRSDRPSDCNPQIRICSSVQYILDNRFHGSGMQLLSTGNQTNGYTC